MTMCEPFDFYQQENSVTAELQALDRHAKHQAALPFEIKGYFEETILPSGKAATWPIKTVPAVLGEAGKQLRPFAKGQVIMIDRGHKAPEPYKFSHDCVLKVVSHAICGRMKEKLTT